jgi:hypothetical protein
VLTACERAEELGCAGCFSLSSLLEKEGKDILARVRTTMYLH